MLKLAIKDRDDKVDLDRSRITIGRDAGNTVVLEADDVSGHHAEIHCDAGNVYLVDLGSANGTTVNGKRLEERRKLSAWDRVGFASVEAEIEDSEGRRPTQMFRAVGQDPATAMPGPWRLVGDNTTFEVTASHVLGRDSGCDFKVASSEVSRRHARLEVRDGKVTVTDLGSANGTFVNGQRVQERVLAGGDEVKFDEQAFRLEGPPDAGRTSVRPAVGDDATQLREAVGSRRPGAPRGDGRGDTALVATASARLEVVGGMDARSFNLAGTACVVGRAPGSDIQLAVDSVSSRHARLERTDDGWRIADLQSTNGTFVNGQRIDRAVLKPGDEVRFGEVDARFAGEAAQAAAAAATTVMPARSDTTFVELTRRLPAWSYGAIAFAVVAVGAGLFLLRDQLPEVTPLPDDTQAMLQASQMWILQGGDDRAVVGTPALGRINDDDFLDVVIPEFHGFATVVDGEKGKLHYRKSVDAKVIASASIGEITEEGPAAAVLANQAGVVYAFDDEGQTLWTSGDELDAGAVANKPLILDVDGDRLNDVIVPTMADGLVALNGNRGWKLWDTGEMTSGAVVGSPVAADVNGDDVVDIVAATDTGQVLVVSASGGDVWQLWSVELSGRVEYASPTVIVVGDVRLVVVATSEGIVALDGASGRAAWQQLAGENFQASPLAVDFDRDGIEDVLVVTGQGNAYVLDGRYGEDLSAGNIGAPVLGTPALYDEDGDGVADPVLVTRRCGLVVLDMARMRPKLAVDVPARGECFASPVLGDLDRDGNLDVVVASQGGTVAAYSFNRRVRTGSIVWGEFLGLPR